MAIKVKVETDSGILVADSYARIETYGGSKTLASIDVYFYVNEQAPIQGKKPIKIASYRFSPSVTDESENIIKQGYEHLKSLPEFSEAIDA